MKHWNKQNLTTEGPQEYYQYKNKMRMDRTFDKVLIIMNITILISKLFYREHTNMSAQNSLQEK